MGRLLLRIGIRITSLSVCYPSLMRIRTHRPAATIPNKIRRCDACRLPNHLTRPDGGRFHKAGAGVSDILGHNNIVQGCWFCMTPNPRSGGKLGDLATPIRN